MRGALAPDKALIGFCGAPWTVATYMIAGAARRSAAGAAAGARGPERFQRLIDILVEASARYLIGQVEAGADVVKIFDSWAGVLDEEGFERWCDRADASDRRARAGRGAERAGHRVSARRRRAARRAIARETGVDAVAVDWMTPMRLARELVPAPMALQAISIRCAWSPAARRSTTASTRSLRRCGAGRISSISATASRRTRRSHMSSGWSSGCAEATALMLWVKAFHIISVIAWMAALLYLPRLFVYHADSARRLGEVGDLQGHGAAAPARHRQLRR